MKIKCETDEHGKVLNQCSVQDDELENGGVYFDSICFQECYLVGAQRIEVPARPSQAHTWNWVTKQWDIDIELLRVGKLIEIKASRDSAEYGLFTYSGYTLDGDSDAQRRLAGLVSPAKAAIAAGVTFTKEFTLADNSIVAFTAEDFVGIEMAKIWQVDAAFTKYRELRVQVLAAETVEEIESVTWS